MRYPQEGAPAALMDPFLAASFFVFGLAFGSFLNVCIHRLPRRIELRERLHRVQDRLRKLQQEPGDDAVQLLQRGALENEIRELRAEVERSSIVAPRSACPSCRT